MISKQKQDYVQGFMDKISESMKPKSIINTLHSLDGYGVNSKDYELIIQNESVGNVKYLLKVNMPGKDIKIKYYDNEHKEVEETYKKVTYMEITVKKQTLVSRKHGDSTLYVDSADWIHVKSDIPDDFLDGYSLGHGGMIRKIKIVV